jgi:hypothetical protein
MYKVLVESAEVHMSHTQISNTHSHEHIDMNSKSNPFKIQIRYWLMVIVVSLMAWRSLTEFGRAERFLKPGWQRQLTEVCNSDKTVCKSVAFDDRDTWWSRRVYVVVSPRLDAGANEQVALQLVDSSLTSDQRNFLKVVLLNNANEAKQTGARP